MDEQRIKSILEDTYDRWFSGDIFQKGRQVYRRLRLKSAEKTAALPGRYAAAEQMLTERGEIQERTAGSRLLAVVGGGMKSKNPALLEVVFTAEGLTARAWAKEGVIPQGTAKSTVAALLKALEA